MRFVLAFVTALALCLPAVAAQPAPNEAGPARNFAQNNDRGDNGRGRNLGRGGENRDGRDLGRGRDFRGDNNRGRFFNYGGRQYGAVRAPAFSYPRGWAYRPWYSGNFLPRMFIAAPYFIDYGFLGLPPPPRGHRWVRYGPDALLVNVYDGRIVDVIYDAFY